MIFPKITKSKIKNIPILAAIFGCVSLYAQTSATVPAASTPSPEVRIYDDANGLSHNHITRVQQDSKGFIWVATWNGLNRFDGVEFDTFKVQPGDGNDVSNDRIRDFFVDKDGTFLCLVHETIYRFDTRTCRFSSVSPAVQLSNESISQYYYTDGNGQKVYGTAKNFLTDEEAAQYTIANVMAGDKTTSAKGFWNPQAVVEKTAVPVLSESNGVVTWTADEYAICYVVTVNGKPVAFPTEASFTAQNGDVVTVQSVNEHGALSTMSEPLTVGSATGIKDVNVNLNPNSNFNYNLAGQRVSSNTKGIIIKNGTKVVIK